MLTQPPGEAGERASLTGSIVDYIDENYASGISLRDVAQAFSYSPCHLTYAFRRNTGIPVTAWIIKRRIAAACELLAASDLDVATVCERVGFKDVCHFTRQFVRHAGTTPGRFRNAMKAARSPHR
jgi:AraC-like DNA-binding protein